MSHDRSISLTEFDAQLMWELPKDSKLPPQNFWVSDASLDDTFDVGKNKIRKRLKMLQSRGLVNQKMALWALTPAGRAILVRQDLGR